MGSIWKARTLVGKRPILFNLVFETGLRRIHRSTILRNLAMYPVLGN